MNKEIEELLKILKMEENDQIICLTALNILLIVRDKSGKNERLESLAEAAFRLRNECHDPFGWCAWDRACWEVWKYYHRQYNSNIFERKHLSLETREKYCSNWMLFWADPIHWIIAALITKEIIANPEEKFDDHLVNESTIEKLKKVIEFLNKSLSIIDDIQPIVKSPVCDQLCEIGEDIDSILTKLSKLGNDDIPVRELAYGIAQNDCSKPCTDY